MRARLRDLESVAALAACTAAAVLVSRRLLRSDVLSADALVHQYWMRSFRDPQLFTDPLTAELRESSRYPDGYEALFRIASHVVDPIVFGEWLGVGLMALSGWLIFAIVREHTAWRPAAWLAAALFLALTDVHRFHGGFPRAFVHPVVLLAVLLAIRRRHAPAALVAAGGALLYPPAALLALGVLGVSALRWTGRRPHVDRRRAAFAALAAVLAGVAVLAPQLAAGGAPEVFTAGEARAYPEFGPRGPLHFFAGSTLDYLTQNRSGFDLRVSGTILALAALLLLAARPGNLRLLRIEVLAMPAVALAWWAIAQAVLFRLYLPHRYTYPLVAFFAIAVGVALRPTLAERLRLPAGAAAAAGAMLLAVILVVPGQGARGTPCPQRPVTRYLASLPKDAVIAGDPADLMCLPVTARRPVVTSTQLAPAYEKDYFLNGRARMFAMLRAYYGQSPAAVAALAERYGATDLWVRRDMVQRELTPRGARWKARKLPYGRFVRRLVRGGEPAVLRLPATCRRFKRGPNEVYDVGCIGAWARSSRVGHTVRQPPA